MGGRGSSSGAKGGATPQQKHIMNNMVKSLAKNAAASSPRFHINDDGSISWNYSETRMAAKVHAGKMISPEKDDVVERKTIKSGTIAKDGFIRFNPSVTTETLVKKGKR